MKVVRDDWFRMSAEFMVFKMRLSSQVGWAALIGGMWKLMDDRMRSLHFSLHKETKPTVTPQVNYCDAKLYKQCQDWISTPGPTFSYVSSRPRRMRLLAN